LYYIGLGRTGCKTSQAMSRGTTLTSSLRLVKDQKITSFEKRKDNVSCDGLHDCLSAWSERICFCVFLGYWSDVVSLPRGQPLISSLIRCNCPADAVPLSMKAIVRNLARVLPHNCRLFLKSVMGSLRSTRES